MLYACNQCGIQHQLNFLSGSNLLTLPNGDLIVLRSCYQKECIEKHRKAVSDLTERKPKIAH